MKDSPDIEQSRRRGHNELVLIGLLVDGGGARVGGRAVDDDGVNDVAHGGRIGAWVCLLVLLQPVEEFRKPHPEAVIAGGDTGRVWGY